jgi:hypothetical protein
MVPWRTFSPEFAGVPGVTFKRSSTKKAGPKIGPAQVKIKRVFQVCLTNPLVLICRLCGYLHHFCAVRNRRRRRHRRHRRRRRSRRHHRSRRRHRHRRRRRRRDIRRRHRYPPPPPPPPLRVSRGRASLIFSCLPLKSWPSSSRIAASIPSLSFIVTKANPRGRPVSRSMTTAISFTCPWAENSARISSSVTS